MSRPCLILADNEACLGECASLRCSDRSYHVLVDGKGGKRYFHALVEGQLRSLCTDCAERDRAVSL